MCGRGQGGLQGQGEGHYWKPLVGVEEQYGRLRAPARTLRSRVYLRERLQVPSS